MNTYRNERGFVLPGVIAMLTLVSLIATIKLSASLDEHRSASSMRHSVSAFYSAEAGLAAVRDTWGDTTQTLDSIARTLSPGDSLVVGAGWQALAGGGSYRASIRRVDAGVQRMYRISVEGQDANGSGGLLALSQLVTPAPSGEKLTFGECCDAAVTLRGTATGPTRHGCRRYRRKPAGMGCERSLHSTQAKRYRAVGRRSLRRVTREPKHA